MIIYCKKHNKEVNEKEFLAKCLPRLCNYFKLKTEKLKGRLK